MALPKLGPAGPGPAVMGPARRPGSVRVRAESAAAQYPLSSIMIMRVSMTRSALASRRESESKYEFSGGSARSLSLKFRQRDQLKKLVR